MNSFKSKMRSLILFVILLVAFAAARPVSEEVDRVKRDYDPRTEAPRRLPADDDEVDGEDRVKRDYDPRTDAPIRVPVDPEAEGEDRVKRDLSFSPNTEAPQPPPKHHPVPIESAN